MTVSPKPRRGLRCLAAVAGCALLLLQRASWKQARPSDPGQMVCGAGVALCGVLTLATGLGAGAYKHPTPSVHGLWPEVAPYGTSACVKPSLSTSDPRRVVQCYDATGTSDAQIVGFETHEWEKHGECAGVADARAFLTTVCSLAEQPLQAMGAARTAGGDLDAARRAVVGLGLEVFSVDEKNSQLSLSACSDGQTWTLAPVADFPAACGGQRVDVGQVVWTLTRPLFVTIALVLLFCALVRAGTDEPTSAKAEPPAGLTKQQLARLEEGGDEASKPPSSSLGSSWVEQEAPSTPSSAESWAEVKPHEFAELDALNEEEKFTYIHTFIEKNRRERLAREMRPKMQPRGVPAVFTWAPDALKFADDAAINTFLAAEELRLTRERDTAARELENGAQRNEAILAPLRRAALAGANAALAKLPMLARRLRCELSLRESPQPYAPATIARLAAKHASVVAEMELAAGAAE
jgi:hypothetical protein